MDPNNSSQINRQQEIDLQQYQNQDYDDGGYYDDINMGEYDQQMDFEQELTLQIKKSVDNSQYNLNQLIVKIKQQVEQIDKYTAFGPQWSVLYYAACGWKKDLCQQLIGLEGKHTKLIHYNPQYRGIQIQQERSQCLLCCQQSKIIIKGLCGDQFCEDCWKNHIYQRLRNNNIEPFPPCLNDMCPIRVAPKICWYFSETDQKFKKLFINTLCRSYATYNRFVKICKGRPGIDCNRCFAITKMFQVIECDTCGSFICPRCGQEAHGLTVCYDQKNWKNITENSLQFVDFLNYKICPSCKQGVQRQSGCNSIICKCKHEFCFICGESWLPNHSHHGDQSCYRYKQILALNQQKKAKRQQGKDFFLKVEKAKDEMGVFIRRAEKVYKIRSELNKKSIPLLLKHFALYENQLSGLYDICTLCIKANYFLKGWKMALYFRPNQIEQMRYEMMKGSVEEMSQFLIQFYDRKIQAILKPEQDRIMDQMDLFEQNKKIKFVEELHSKLSKMKPLTNNVTNMMTRGD